jgi:ElaB/YqjD/DUF883 family membrane-anchored ribosome-binding protein
MKASAMKNYPENPATDRAAALAHETIDRVAGPVGPAEQSVRSAAESTSGAAKRVHDQALETASENLGKVRSYVERNPLTSVGAAFAAGALLVSWLRR